MTQQPTNREPRYKLEHDGMGTYISDDEIPVTQPPTDQGEAKDMLRAELSHYMSLYAECRSNKDVKGMSGWLTKVEATIAREREAAANEAEIEHMRALAAILTDNGGRLAVSRQAFVEAPRDNFSIETYEEPGTNAIVYGLSDTPNQQERQA